MKFPIDRVRKQFPALSIKDDGIARIYADNPAGTQVPITVANAVHETLLAHNANLGGHFATSIEAGRVVDEAHEKAAEFLGARSAGEVVIGQSMTSLSFHLSRSICRDFSPGDEIVITRMEHEGNVAPWLEMAADKDLVIKWVDFDLDSWQVEEEALKSQLTDRTKLVCLNFSSNMTGSVNDVQTLTKAAKETGALVYVDAVQLAPHHLVDVQALGCDFLVCSSYKFFGPHLGLLWGQEDILLGLHAYKCRCASDELPEKFELGTPQLELLAGLSATFDYFVSIGSQMDNFESRREMLSAAYRASRDHEEPMTSHLISGLMDISGVEIFGITNPNRVHERVPTVSFRHGNIKPSEIAQSLSDKGIFVWHGHNYAYEPARYLGIPVEEGVLRIGLAHYNTLQEVERIIAAVGEAVSTK